MRHIAATLSVFGAASLTACVMSPSVTVREEPGGVFIDTRLLGEYPSDIGTVEVNDLTENEVVWSIRPDGEMFQTHGFHLSPGPNRAVPDIAWGRVIPVVPDQGSPFTLKVGTMYEIAVCAPGGSRHCAKRSFKMK